MWNSLAASHTFTIVTILRSQKEDTNLIPMRKLIAYELSHMIQQWEGLSGEITQEGRPRDTYEREANLLAE